MTASRSDGRRRGYNVATPDRLLDAAERLFAVRNYASVTLREIAREASANVGQIAYHFGQKDALIRATIRRRAEELNRDRIKLLDQYEQLVGPDNVKVEPLVRAFILPYFRRLQDGNKQWCCFATFVGRSVWDGRLSGYMSESFDEAAQLYTAAFQRALPKLDHAEATRCFQFMLALMHCSTARDQRIEALIIGAGGSTSYAAYLDLLIPYVSAGFNAAETSRHE